MKLAYRPEVDGLRAIAVFAVILYHAEIIFFGENFFEGGFIGVDIFFVISGYLITSFILRELEEFNSFSFINFYERRVRRILPVLLLVILASVPLAWKYLFPSQFVEYAYSLISSLFFSSNFYFHFMGQEYGAQSSLLKPFLHIWSLSVEEQFYILYPVVLFIFFKKFKRYLTSILIVGLLMSLVLADWGSRNYASLNFYILPTRSWELLAGALLAKLEIDFGRFKKKNFFNFFPVIGLLLIIHSIIFFDENMFHPSFYSLSPIIGVMIIIYFSEEDEFVTKILSSKLFVGLGLISYSLYLWHYPIFAFARVNEFLGDNSSKKLLLILLTILLSIISYFLVEKPFRKKNRIKTKYLFTYVLGVGMLIFSISIFIILNDGIKDRFPLHIKMYKNNEIDNEILRKKSWKFLSNKIKVEFKSSNDSIKFSPQFSNNTNLKKVLFIGDSLSKDLFNVFFQNKNLFSKFEFARYGVRIKNFGDKNYDDIFLKSFNFINSDIIVVSTAWWHDDLNKIKILQDYCLKNNKVLIITSKPPEFRAYTRDPLFDFYLKSLIKQEKTEYSYDHLNSLFYENLIFENFITFNEKLKKISHDLNILYLDKYDFMCDDNKKECDGVTPDGYKVFYDHSHYTLEGAKYLGKKIYNQNWFKIK